MNAPKSNLYIAYVAVVAGVLPYVASFGIQQQGFHSNSQFYGWVMAEWFRIPFAYTVFLAAVAAVLVGLVALIQRKLIALPGLAVLLGVGFLAYEWSPFTDLICHAAGSAPGCLK